MVIYADGEYTPIPIGQKQYSGSAISARYTSDYSYLAGGLQLSLNTERNLMSIQEVIEAFQNPDLTDAERLYPYYLLKYDVIYDSLSEEQRKMMDGVQGLLFPRPPKMNKHDFITSFAVAQQSGLLSKKKMDTIYGEIESWINFKPKDEQRATEST
jgi:hypothetical protein